MCTTNPQTTTQQPGAALPPEAAAAPFVEGSNPAKEVNWWDRNGLIVSFFIAILVCGGIYLYAVYQQQNSFEKGVEKIVSIYNNKIVKQNQDGRLPLIIPIQQQQQQEQERFHEEIKALLEMQQSRIQDNFESFEIWAGILTIVFLVFSFFSLQKSEQMEQQSRESLRRIKSNMHDSESKLSQFDMQAESKLSTFETKSGNSIRTFETDYKNHIESFKEKSTSALGGINAKMEEAKIATIAAGKHEIVAERRRMASEMVEQLDKVRQQMSEEFETSVGKKSQELLQFFSNAQGRLENILKDAEELYQRISDARLNDDESSEEDETAPIDEIKE